LPEWLHTERLGGRPFGQPRVVGEPAAVALHPFGRAHPPRGAVRFAPVKLADSKRTCCWSKVFYSEDAEDALIGSAPRIHQATPRGDALAADCLLAARALQY
jgi:hypothetical protein